MDGPQATGLLRADDVTRGIPGHRPHRAGLEGDKERILQAGCDGYIDKPIPYQVLLDTVDRFLPSPPHPARLPPATPA
jgi:two-component system, cell cycle response regulator DivK